MTFNHHQDNWVWDHSQVPDLSDPSKKLLSEGLQSPHYNHTLKPYGCGICSWCYKLVAGYCRREGHCSSFSEQTLEHLNTGGIWLSSSLTKVIGWDNTSSYKSCELHFSGKGLLFISFQRGVQRCLDGMDSSLFLSTASFMIEEPIFLAQIMLQMISLKKPKII